MTQRLVVIVLRLVVFDVVVFVVWFYVVMVELWVLVVYGFFDNVRHLLFDVDGNWSFYGNFHGNWYLSLHWVRDVLDYWVWVQDWHFYFVWNGLFNMNWNWSIDRYMNWVRNFLDNFIRYRLVHWNCIWFFHMDGHGSVNVHLDGVVYNLLDWVGFRHMDNLFDRYVNDLFNWIRLWDGHFNFNRDVLDHWSWHLDGYLHWHGTINVHVHGVVALLHDGVRFWDVDRHFNDFLDWNMDDSFYGIWGGHSNLVRNGNMLDVLHGDILLYFIRHWYLLDYSQSLFHVSMSVSLVPAMTSIVATESVATAEVVPSKVVETSFVLLSIFGVLFLFSCFRSFSCLRSFCWLNSLFLLFGFVFCHR